MFSIVAIAYVMYKAPYVFPIIGGRKVEHLKANMQALDIVLTEEQIQFLDSIVPFDPGFPHNMIVSVVLYVRYTMHFADGYCLYV